MREWKAAQTNAPRPQGKPWTIEEAASYLGVTIRHLRTMCGAGKVKTIRVGKRAVRIPDAEMKRVATEGI